MVYAGQPNFIAIVTLFLLLQFSIARDWSSYQYYRRQEPTSISFVDQASSIADGFLAVTPTDISTGENEKLDAIASTLPASDEVPVMTSASLSFSPSAATSAMNGISTSSSEYPPNANDLPIVPRVTAGFVLAGIVMILTGAVYTITGIRKKWLHIFISSAYLASIGTTVLILYVMNLPVSNAIQAVYVFAVVSAGTVIGGVSILFTEVTEGLGCLLGGFCISMWLLVLQPGGIITGAGKVILIVTLTIGAFSTSFSHYTKPYAPIGFMSFGGATSIVLGIDCFSRAGLKEFWVYLWALNPKLFPVDITSYPLTRGMKAEIGGIFIISLAGIISQLKLWKVIQERRQQKAAKKLQDNRYIDEEEENIGRRIEENNAIERDQWETLYGSNDKTSAPHHGRRDSGVADMLSMKEGPTSDVTSLARFRDAEIERVQERSHANILTDKYYDISSSVAREPQDGIDLGNPIKIHLQGSYNTKYNTADNKGIDFVERADSNAHRAENSLDDSKENLTETKINTSPASDIVSMPLEPPDQKEPLANDRSSVSTYATMGEEDLEIQDRRSRHIFNEPPLQRRMSKYSLTSSKKTRFSATHDLIEDNRSSLAATIDDLSDDEEITGKRSLEIDESLVDENKNSNSPIEQELKSPISETSESGAGRSTTLKNSANQSEIDEKFEKSISSRSSISSSETPGKHEESKEVMENPANEATLTESVTESKAKSINVTQDNLPKQLSKVFMSYRTNEWAKHLSYAEAPEIEDLRLSVNSDETQNMLQENPVPVNVFELQQTSTNQFPVPTARDISEQKSVASRMSSVLAHDLANPRIISSGKRRTYHSQKGVSMRNRSQKLLSISQQGMSAYDLSTTTKAPPQAHLRTMPGSSETLIGKRESIIKRKSLYRGNWGSSVNDFSAATTSQASSSDTGSLLAGDDDDEDMPLSQRRNLIRQSSFVSSTSWSGTTTVPPMSVVFDSHQPRRRSAAVNQRIRHHQMASWRASLQQDFRANLNPRKQIEQQRNLMRMSRRNEEMRRSMEVRIRDEREEAWGEKMRSREMLDAHRDAMRRMQQAANRGVN